MPKKHNRDQAAPVGMETTYTLFDIKRRKKAQKDYESRSLQYGNVKARRKPKPKGTTSA